VTNDSVATTRDIGDTVNASHVSGGAHILPEFLIVDVARKQPENKKNYQKTNRIKALRNSLIYGRVILMHDSTNVHL